MTHFGTPQKDVALALALAAGVDTATAAEQAGFSRRTAYRKIAEPAFRQLVAQLRAEFLAQAMGRLVHNMSRAADGLVAMLDSGDERVRLRVIRALLTLGLKLHEAVDFEQRLTQLEAEVARKQGVMP